MAEGRGCLSDKATSPPGTDPRLPILFQGEDWIAVHKPSGIHTHPSALSPGEDSIARWLGTQLKRHIWPVHRLDRGASGLLVFALSKERARDLILAFRERRVHKRYLALVRGWLADEGLEERPLRDLDPESREPALQEARTAWHVLARAEAPFCGGRGVGAFPTTRISLIECLPETGRMHQIRRHLARPGHPLLGDNEHGDRHLNRILAREIGLERMALTCVELALPNASGEVLRLETRLDPDLVRVLDRLGMTDPCAAVAGPALLDGLYCPKRVWRHRIRAVS